MYHLFKHSRLRYKKIKKQFSGNHIMDDTIIIQKESIASYIYFIRGEKVIIDFSLAQLYGVDVKVLKRVVRRHKQRFPEDFMFEP